MQRAESDLFSLTSIPCSLPSFAILSEPLSDYLTPKSPPTFPYILTRLVRIPVHLDTIAMFTYRRRCRPLPLACL